MDKDDTKSRGKKHLTNKKKYNKNKPAVHVPSQKPKIALESNWDRYEVKDNENKLSSSTDFAVLASAPITHGSHFQFKSDKDILEVAEPVTSSLFNLDLTLLEKSLATVPFSVRSGISQDVFSESQHRVMTALRDNVNDYEAYLSGRQSRPDVVFGSDGDSSGDSDADETASADRTPSPEINVRDPADLEQWLDAVLDD